MRNSRCLTFYKTEANIYRCAKYCTNILHAIHGEQYVHCKIRRSASCENNAWTTLTTEAVYYISLSSYCSHLGYLAAKSGITREAKLTLFSLTDSRWSLIMQRPSSMSFPTMPRSQVFVFLKVLNERLTAHVVTGSANATSKTFATDGKCTLT